ncbi:MAG: RNA polymerase sigma factor [bacterium]|nr:RNA polymerase sigma factor [bacterium]
MDENALIRNIVSGDRESFKLLVQKYEKPLFFFIRKMILFNSDFAEDVFQETLLKAFKNLRQYDPLRGASFKTWLYSIAVHETRNFYKSNSRYTKSTIYLDTSLLDNIKSTYNMTDELMQKDLLQKTMEIIHSLKPKYRIVINMKIFESLKFHEIAGMLHESERNVKYKIEKAMDIIKKELKKAGYENLY